MKITLKNMQKVEVVAELPGPGATVGDLFQKAEAAFGSSSLTLIYLGTVLGDKSKTLAEVGIADGGVIIVVMKKAQTNAPPVSSPQPAAAPAAPAAAAAAAAPSPSTLLSLSVVVDGGDVRPIEVESDETVENLKAILEVEFNIPMARQILLYETRDLSNSSRLCDIGIRNNDMLMLSVRPNAPVRPVSAAPQNPRLDLNMFGNIFNPLQRFMKEAEALLQQAAIDPHFRRRVREQHAALADALDSNNAQNVAKELSDIDRLKRENEAKKTAAIMRLNANPLDVDAQREIEEAIRLENIERNLEQAMEYNPESFGRVVMLYIDCEVNGKPIKAFVDSGAQSTIMSLQCAERMGLMRLVDKRCAGIAKGVGTSKIIGRVHAVEMKIGSNFFTVSITVLENNDMEFLFGLDNLRRHQCILDFKDNVLRINNDAVPFLGEADIPVHLRESDAGGGDDAMDTDAPAAAKGGGGAAGAAGSADPAVEGLIGMGFTREQAIAALRSAGGNAELAASILFGGD